jgi:hypothetical protein
VSIVTRKGIVPHEPGDVFGWRFDELRKAGYGYENAICLADREDIDLHVACDLLAGGCSVEQALEILL